MNDYVQVDIVGLSTSPSTGGAYALVLGEIEGTRRLPIIIGGFEAQAIALELEKIQTPRPMTHDLLRNVFEAVGAEVTEIIIDDLRDGTFYAKIRFIHNGEEMQLDARPSDAVALAVRVEAPIFVAEHVMAEASLPVDDEDLEESAEEPYAERESAPERKPARPSRPLSKIEEMEAQLQKAIENEDYERAAQLRDEINRLKQQG